MSSSTLKLTVAQYDAMVLKGAFDDLPQKIELIQGEIQAMNPAGPTHDDLIEYLNHWSTRSTDETKVRVRVQSGLSLPELASRPEPDLMWIRADRLRGRHPQAHEVLLLVEVADSSLRRDRTLKADLYAAAGVTEYWIVNSEDRLLHVYRDPGRHGYATVTTFRQGDCVAPLAEPQARLTLSDLFGSAP